MSAGKVSHTRELRQLLARTIRQVQRGDIKPADARAIAELAKAIIQGARLDLELVRIVQEVGEVELEPIIGPITGPPKILAISHDKGNDELLREKICAVLGEGEVLSPREIGRKVSAPTRRVAKVLEHDWFQKTTDGYRMAESC